ncbi:MAG: flagella basal body P-ring formation protein FlgA [Edaphobacter sp.]
MSKIFLCWIAALSVQGAASTALAQIVCARTPAAAVKSIGTESLPMPEGKGYRVTSVHWDPVMRQNWATIANCEHPEWPEASLRVGETNGALSRSVIQVSEEHSPKLPIIRAGDIVRLWRQEDLLRIEVTGVAEESGSVGKTIRVRLLRRNTDDQSQEEQYTGIVRGPSDVEMLP